MRDYVLRVWLPDRPGTLGRVAAAIGSGGADVVGIEILERGAGTAIDEIVVRTESSVDAVLVAVAAVEGVAVEDVHEVAPDRPDHGVMALGVVARLVEADPDDRAETLVRATRELLEADWVALVDASRHHFVAVDGEVPDAAWLMAFLTGTDHLDNASEHTPSDVVWTRLGDRVGSLAGERRGRAFRDRERKQVELLGRIGGAIFAQ